MRGKILLLIFLIMFPLCEGYAFFREDKFDLEKVLKSRPSKNQYLYDYANILEDVGDYSNRYLKSIRDNCAIEAMIVSLPSLDKAGTIEQVAVEIVDNWKIGKDYAGRGILLLLADKEKQVKLEVSYELEDVFTDMFSGYVEDLQLKPYFLSGNLGIGLLAVMEELENRAQIKHQREYTKESIQKLDKGLLSGGAGAKRDLTKFEQEKIKDVGARYPAGNTPDEAWQTLIQSWRDKARDPNLGVYTEITKLTYRDYQNLPDSRYEKDVRTYSGKPYEVIQNENYAAIFFGNKKGWENSPFLFCRAPDGWKFDIVHQRKYVRMGSSPNWGIERGDYPYISLLSRCHYWMGQDIPLEPDDIYRIEDDKKLAEEIIQLEKIYKNNPNDFNAAMELGRLYTITSMGPKNISILKKAKGLNPDSALPFKYLAIAYVDATYQYKKAIEEMKEYIVRLPDDIFSHNYLGYLYFQTGNYDAAIKEFKKVIKLGADNCYAYCKLSRIYGKLYLSAVKLDPRRTQYKNKAVEMLQKANTAAFGSSDIRRISWLEHWLEKQGILAE